MDYRNLTVILPTLNEKETIGKLIKLLSNAYSGIKIIVVDDNSTDGTIEIVKSLASSMGNVRLIERSGKEKGLTGSIIDGIMASKTKYVVVMDADMQHPFEIIKEIRKKLYSGNNLVVAVRSKVPHWSLYRKLISKMFMYFGYIVLFLSRKPICSDIMSGYFGIERQLFVDTYKANEKRFVKTGYKVLFDLLKCMDKKSVKIAEVPYVFHIREYGSSKAGVKQGLALLKSFFS